jgi:glycosyltransferase involved in cell wall biosynthesis
MRKAAFFHNLPTGGALRVASRQLSALRNDYSWTMYVPEGSAGMPDLPEVRVESVPFPGGVRASILSRLAFPISLYRRLTRFDRSCRRAAAMIRDSKAEVILAHTSMIAAAPPLLRYLEAPSVYYSHEYPRCLYERRIHLTRWAMGDMLLPHVMLKLRRLDVEAARSATVFVSNSEHMAGRMRGIYDREIRVVYPGVDTDLFAPAEEASQASHVLSVGALSSFKGHHLVVRAVAKLPPPGRPGVLVVADRGSDRYARYLYRLADRLSVQLAVLRRIPDPDLVQLYGSSRAVVCAQMDEPYGLVPLEAMSCGRPVIAVDQGGFPENVEDGITGILVDRTEESIAEALGRILGDHRLAADLSENGRSFVLEKRSVDQEMRRMREALEEALALGNVPVSS